MKKIVGILLATVLIVSCRNKEQLGPDLVGIYGSVNIISPLAVNTSSVDFSTGGKVFFTARFEKSAVWTITITEANGSKKTINGISKEINSENSTWEGTADTPPSFVIGTATATLTFKNDPSVTENVSFSITGKHNSDYPSDVLVSDFTVDKSICYCALPPAPNDTVPKAKWPRDFPKFNNTETVYGYPDGNPYVIMGDTSHPYNTNSGRPWQGNGSPYVDILTISPRNSQINYGTYYPLYADPTKVYFNIMVYNTGTPTWLKISFFEEEAAGPGVNPDRYIDIKPNWVGWKLISIKYSDLTPNSSDAITNIQPQKITDIQIVMLSNLPASDPALPNTPIKTAFDHIIFTHNAPYQP